MLYTGGTLGHGTFAEDAARSTTAARPVD